MIFTRTRTATKESHDRGSLLLLWPVITPSIFLGTWYGHVNPPDLFRNAFEARLLSMLLLAARLAMRWMAILKLGRSFMANVVIREEQRVEKTGVFRFVRHPSYTGLLIIFTGIGLNTLSWIGLSCTESMSKKKRSATPSGKSIEAIALPRNVSSPVFSSRKKSYPFWSNGGLKWGKLARAHGARNR